MTRTGVELPEFRKLGGMLSNDEGSSRSKSDAVFKGRYLPYGSINTHAMEI